MGVIITIIIVIIIITIIIIIIIIIIINVIIYRKIPKISPSMYKPLSNISPPNS